MHICNPSTDGAKEARLSFRTLQAVPNNELLEIQLETGKEWRQLGIVLALHALGKHEEEIERREEYIAEYGNVWMFQVAQMYAFHGDIDSGFEWLNRAYDGRDSGMTLVHADPFLSSLRDDPRWGQLLQKMGLSE